MFNFVQLRSVHASRSEGQTTGSRSEGQTKAGRANTWARLRRWLSAGGQVTLFCGVVVGGAAGDGRAGRPEGSSGPQAAGRKRRPSGGHAHGREGRGLTITGVPAVHDTRDICSWVSCVVRRM